MTNIIKLKRLIGSWGDRIGEWRMMKSWLIENCRWEKDEGMRITNRYRASRTEPHPVKTLGLFISAKSSNSSGSSETNKWY